MNIWKRYSMRVSKNWVKFNKMFTLSPWVIYYQLLPKMKEANAVLLMDKFIYYLKQHRLYTRTLGII